MSRVRWCWGTWNAMHKWYSVTDMPFVSRRQQWNSCIVVWNHCDGGVGPYIALNQTDVMDLYKVYRYASIASRTCLHILMK